MAETRRVMGKIRSGQSVGIFIGPEGGFEESEVEEAVAAGAQAITLGQTDSADRDGRVGSDGYAFVSAGGIEI